MQPPKILTDSHENSSRQAEQFPPTEQSKSEQNGSAPRPDALQVLTDNIPDELKQCRQWVTWRFDWDKERTTYVKTPFQANGKHKAKSTDPNTWGTYEACLQTYEAGRVDGVGFVVCDQDKYTGVDLDGCVNLTTGETEPAALALVEQLDSYTELSPSGTGLRIFIRGKLPRDEKGKARSRCAASWKRGDEKAEIEIYDTARYLTMTGHHRSGTPRTIESRQTQLNELHAQLFPAKPPRPKAQPSTCTPLSLNDNELLEKAFVAKNGAKARALYGGDIGAHPSPSEADSALCCHLAFWTRDAAQIDRIWLSSALMRDKAEREDYRQRTIENALETVTETYTPKEEKFRHGEYRAPQGKAADESGETDAANTGTRFILRSLAEIAARPPRQYLIAGLLYADGTSLITAKQATFKTFFSIDMALCVATGDAWHGHAVKRGAVVYIAAEGAAGIVKRVQAWCDQHGCEFPTNFHIIDEPAQIADATLLAQFIEAVSKVEPALIVVDTLARCAVGLDENSAKDMGEFVEALRVLAARTGAHVQTVHHNNKAGEYRGSSALVAAVDTWLCLERPEYGDYVTLRCEKMKDDEAPPPMVFEKQTVYLDDYARETSLIFTLTSQSTGSGFGLNATEEKVFSELAQTFGEDGATVAEWKRSCEAVGIIERTFQRTKKRLDRLKMVYCDEPGKRGAKWTLTPTGQAMANPESDGDNGDVSPICHPLSPSQPMKGDRVTHPFRGVTHCHPSEDAAVTEETSEPYATFGPSAETEAKRAAIMEAGGPTHCRACKKPLTDKEKRGHAQWEGDTPRIECARCQAFYSDAPMPAENENDIVSVSI